LSIASSSPEQGGLGGTGANNNAPGPLGNVRQAFLGLGNKYGNLTAGWQYTPEYFQRTTNIGGSANSLGIAATTASNGGIAVASRLTHDSMNAFKYESPKFMNATLTAMVGTVNTTTNSTYLSSTTASANAQTLNSASVTGNQAVTQTGFGQAYAVNWAAGNAQATVSYSQENARNSTNYTYSTGGQSTDSLGNVMSFDTTGRNFMASGSYDFGIVKLMGFAANRRSVANATQIVTNADIMNVGAFVPVTPTIKLGANYAYAHVGASGKDTKNQAFQTSVQYSLSKRTTAYVLASRAVASAGNTPAASTSSLITSANQYSLGLAHTF
jgi:predicted porin